MARNNPGRSGAPNRNGRPARPVDPYSLPDEGGMVIRSLAERPVTLVFSVDDAQRILEALRSRGTSDETLSYISSKIAATLDLNDRNQATSDRELQAKKTRKPRVPRASYSEPHPTSLLAKRPAAKPAATSPKKKDVRTGGTSVPPVAPSTKPVEAAATAKRRRPRRRRPASPTA